MYDTTIGKDLRKLMSDWSVSRRIIGTDCRCRRASVRRCASSVSKNPGLKSAWPPANARLASASTCGIYACTSTRSLGDVQALMYSDSVIRSGRSARDDHVERFQSDRSWPATLDARSNFLPQRSVNAAFSRRRVKSLVITTVSRMATAAPAARETVRTAHRYGRTAGHSELDDIAMRGRATASHATRIESGTEVSARRASSGLRRKPASSTSVKTATIASLARARGHEGLNASRDTASTNNAKNGSRISK